MEISEARQRGVIFDVGHGAGSFAFATARDMLEAGFLPDVISSDIHTLSVDGPAYDILAIMSKFYCLGVGLNEVIKAATVAPAAAMHRSELGTLAVGSVGDAAILEIAEGAFTYTDVMGETITGRHRLRLRGMIVGGCWWDPSPTN